MISYHSGAAGAVTLGVDANAISPFNPAFRDVFGALLARLEAEREHIAGVAIEFVGDSDVLADADAIAAADAAGMMAILAAYQDLLRRLERLGRPVTARVDRPLGGHALGLALACHRRVAGAAAVLSLPQVKVGLLPADGSIARLARLVGVQAALPLLAEGRALDAAGAAACGLASIDADAGAPSAQPWDVPGFRIPGGAPNSPQLQVFQQVAPAMLRQKTQGHYPAPEAILCALIEGAQVDFDTALLVERRYATAVATGAVARNLLRLARLQGAAQDRGAAERIGASLRDELAALAADGAPAVLVANALRNLGMQATPGVPASAASEPSFDDVRDRLLYSQAIAALAALEGGAARDAIDLAAVNTCGFPAWAGGALGFIDHVGPGRFAARAAELCRRYGTRFAPSENWQAARQN